MCDFDEIIGLPTVFKEGTFFHEVPKKKTWPRKFRIRREYSNPIEYLQRYRLSERLVNKLAEILACLEPKATTNHALTAKQKILIFLRFIASNSFYYEIQVSKL